MDGGGLADCPNGSRWVRDVFSECARDGRDVASVVLGLVSIGCFAAASFPQFYQACKTGIMDQALSIYFLLGWLGGDLLNLIGSFLANQLPLQVYTAVYYVLADLVMLSLYGYYKAKNQSGGFRAPINAAFVFLFLGTVSTMSFLGRDTGLVPEPVTFKGRALLATGVQESGYTYKRKSTVGVSYSLFALVMLGNTLYGVSVLLKNPEPGQSEGDYILHHLPWLIGSLGVLLLDVIISFQFLAYQRGRPGAGEEREALLGEQDEPSDS
ncbi:lysosomal amino acid transporter 1 homolog isoform X2 [Apteryx mantelli]|uniref:Lysosomal amino acid transporter 1 homolog isoform X2 n=1 Tax=Apteryx mantelli TaxID=2696672 RepID=A0ABM4FPZ1_9AVES